MGIMKPFGIIRNVRNVDFVGSLEFVRILENDVQPKTWG